MGLSQGRCLDHPFLLDPWPMTAIPRSYQGQVLSVHCAQNGVAHSRLVQWRTEWRAGALTHSQAWQGCRAGSPGWSEHGIWAQLLPIWLVALETTGACRWGSRVVLPADLSSLIHLVISVFGALWYGGRWLS